MVGKLTNSRSAVIAVLLVMGITILFLFLRSGSTTEAPAPGLAESSGTTAEAILPPVETPVEGRFTGVIIARDVIEVTAQESGRLENVEVGLGDAVKRNAMIAVINSDEVRQELKMAEASLDAAQGEEQKAHLQVAEARDRSLRRADLVQKGLMAKEELTAARLQEELSAVDLRIAQSRVARETAGLEQLRTKQARREVRAPFAGTVAARHQDPGAVVAAGTPIVDLIRSGDLWIRFAVPETDLHQASAGVRITALVTSTGVSLSGIIEQVAPGLDAAGLTLLEAKLDVPVHLREKVRPGMVAQVSIVHR